MEYISFQHFDYLDGRIEDYNIKKIFPDQNKNLLLLARDKEKKLKILLKRYGNSKYEEFSFPNVTEIENLHSLHLMLSGTLLMIHQKRNQDDKYYATIFQPNGYISNPFYAGKCISDCQVDHKDNIWISYSDEEIFDTNSIGKNGIVAFDAKGEIVFDSFDQFVLKEKVPPIDDCYALNVKENDVFLFYYSDYPIVQFEGENLKNIWQADILENCSDVMGFAVCNKYALFADSSNKLKRFSFCDQSLVEIQALNEDKENLSYSHCFGRGSVLFLQEGEKLYFKDLEDENHD